MEGVKCFHCFRGILIFTLFLLLTGCWDRIEIEERGFVVGIAIDMPKTKEIGKKQEKESPDKPKAKGRYVLTQQMVVPGELSGSGNAQGGTGSGKAYLNVTAEGETLFDIIREVAARTSRSPYYVHFKTLVISEEVARTEGSLANVIDHDVK